MSNSNTDQTSNIAKTLGIDSGMSRKKHMKKWVAGGALAIGAMVIIIWNMNKNGSEVNYKTQEAVRGNLTITVTATGNLQPTNQVEVGSELSGIVETVAVDYNDHVKIGQILAKLDTSKLNAQVQQSRASLDAARAKVLQVQATIKEYRNNLARLENVQKLSNNKAVSDHDIEAAQASLSRSLADEVSAKASVKQAGAVLDVYETDLSKADIRSPINGIVLARSVEPGQTVAASLQAPVLFTLAEDLAHMELHVDVDEADVGLVNVGQDAVFTVDAYPERSFPARITQVRFGSKTVEGVVTYETVLNVDNADLSLRPGMTATADITVKTIEKAVLVPNAALRFSPPEKAMAGSDNRSAISRLFPRPPRSPAKQREELRSEKNRQRVWSLKDGELVPVPVTAGSTDGAMTEIISGDVTPGMPLVVDTVSMKNETS